MNFKPLMVAVVTASALVVLGAPAVSAAPAPSGGCKTTADMDKLGRPNATSRCAGHFPSGASHRAVITCDLVQGAREHNVRRTFHSKWTSTGSPATVECGFKASLVGFKSEVRGA